MSSDGETKMTTLDKVLNFVFGARKDTKIPECAGSKDLLKLFKISPIIIPIGGMRVPGTKGPKTLFEFDTTIFPGSKPTRAPTGTQTRADFEIVYPLSWGTIVTAVSPVSGNEPVYKVKNLFNLSPDDIKSLSVLYQRGIDECDLMLLLYRIGSLSEEEIKLLFHVPEVGKSPFEIHTGRSLETILQTLRFGDEGPLYFLEPGKPDFNKLRYSHKYRLISKKIQNWWLGEHVCYPMYFLTKIDYDPMDQDASSVVLLGEQCRNYGNPEGLCLLITRHAPEAYIQCYRRGLISMNKAYTMEIIDFIRNGPIEKLNRLPLWELVLVGGIIPGGEPAKLLTEFLNKVLAQTGHNGRAEMLKRFRTLFVYLSSTSSLPTSIIDIDRRKADHNVLLNLYKIIEQKRPINGGVRGDWPSFQNAVDFGFSCINLLMEIPTTRLHENVVTTLNRFKNLIRIDIENPLVNKFFGVFKDRYKLEERLFVLRSHRRLTSGALQGPFAENEEDSIVVMPIGGSEAVQGVSMGNRPGSAVVTPGITEFLTSVYFYYDKDGNVYRPAEKSYDDGRSTLSTIGDRDIEEILGEAEGTDDYALIASLVDRERLERLYIPFSGIALNNIYAANLKERALVEMLKLMNKAQGDSGLTMVPYQSLEGWETGDPVSPTITSFSDVASKWHTLTTKERFLFSELSFLGIKSVNLRQHVGTSQDTNLMEFLSQENMRKLITALEKYKEHIERLHNRGTLAAQQEFAQIIKTNRSVLGNRVGLLEMLFKAGSLSEDANGQPVSPIDKTIKLIWGMQEKDMGKALDALRKYRDDLKPKGPKPSQAGIKFFTDLYGSDTLLTRDNVTKILDNMKIGSLKAAIEIYRTAHKTLQDSLNLSDEDEYKKVIELMKRDTYPVLLRQLEKLHSEGALTSKMLGQTIAHFTQVSSNGTSGYPQLLTNQNMTLLIEILLLYRTLEEKRAKGEALTEDFKILEEKWAGAEALTEESKALEEKRAELGALAEELKVLAKKLESNIEQARAIPSKHRIFGMDRINANITEQSKICTKFNEHYVRLLLERGKLEQEGYEEDSDEENPPNPDEEDPDEENSSNPDKESPPNSDEEDSDKEDSPGSKHAKELALKERSRQFKNIQIKLEGGFMEDIVPLQIRLTNLIWFGVVFENAIVAFLGKDVVECPGADPKKRVPIGPGPIERNYISEADKVIMENLRSYKEGEQLTSEYILGIYKVKNVPPSPIGYVPDFMHPSCIVPHYGLIGMRNPSYFQKIEVFSLIEGLDKPCFGQLYEKLIISKEELIIMAHLQCKPLFVNDFKKLIIVLYKLKKLLNDTVSKPNAPMVRVELDATKTLFRSMIAAVGSKMIANLKKDDIETLAYLEDNIPLGRELARLMSLLYSANGEKKSDNKRRILSTFYEEIRNARFKQSVQLSSEELEGMEIMESNPRLKETLGEIMKELRGYKLESSKELTVNQRGILHLRRGAIRNAIIGVLGV